MGKKIHNRIRSSVKDSLPVVVYRLTLRVQCRNGFDFWPGTGRAAVTPYSDQCQLPVLPEGPDARTVLPSASTAQSIVANFSVSQCSSDVHWQLTPRRWVTSARRFETTCYSHLKLSKFPRR